MGKLDANVSNSLSQGCSDIRGCYTQSIVAGQLIITGNDISKTTGNYIRTNHMNYINPKQFNRPNEADNGILCLDRTEETKQQKRNLKTVSAMFLLVCLFKLKLEHLLNWKRCFLFHFKSSFRSQENQILEFCILKFHDVIKCLSIKQEIHFTE